MKKQIKDLLAKQTSGNLWVLKSYENYRTGNSYYMAAEFRRGTQSHTIEQGYVSGVYVRQNRQEADLKLFAKVAELVGV